MKKDKLPVSEKYTLSVIEAAQYFGIGINKMRRLAEDNLGVFAVYSGNRYLIIRSEFERYMDRHPEMMEEIRSAKEKLREEKRFQAPGPAQG